MIHVSKLKKEYITACVVGLFTALLGLLTPSAYGQPINTRLFVFLVVVIGLIALKMFFSLRRAEPDPDAPPPDTSRMRRMVFLWYGLCVVLALPTLYRLSRRIVAEQTGAITPLGWMIGVGCAAVLIFALWRVVDFFMLNAQKKTSDT